ncbi:MAG: hypothetical protein DPW16_17555 [Chloroflexi bacterium]|nr:hypothetical protein [Chloroflexota bacterium]
MIIRRKPTGILNRRRPIGSLGQRLLQRSVAQVRRMVISRLPHRHADWETPPMVWNQGDEQDYDWEAEEFAPQPPSDWSRPPAKAPARRSGQPSSVQPTREDEPMPADLQAIYNLHKAMGRVTGESFLHRDAEPDSQKITKTPPTSRPVQASGRYEPPPQRPVTPRNAPPQPTPEPAEAEPPPVQRRVVSKVEYMGVRNMAEEFGLAEPTAESADDFEDDSFDDMPDALPGTFEDGEDSAEYDTDERDTSDSADYNEAVSAAIAKAEAPIPRTAPSNVQASPADILEDDPQEFTQTLIEQSPTSPAGEQAAQTAGNLPSASVQSSTALQPSSPSTSTAQAGQTPPSSQPDSSAGPVDQTFASAPSVIEESENIQRKPADTPSASWTMDDWPTQPDAGRFYTADQLSAAIAQAEAPVQRSEPQVVRAKRIEASEPAIQPMVQRTAYTRVIDEIEEHPRSEFPFESAPPPFERRITGQAVMDSAEFSPRPVENINYAAPAITPPAASSSTPSAAPVGRVARMPETPDMPDTSDTWSEVPDMPQPTVQRRAIPLDEAFDAPPLPQQLVSLDEALEMSGTFTEAAPIQEAPPPVLMPPIGRTRHRDISLNPPSPESARPPAPSASPGGSPVQRSSSPETVNTAVQRAEAPAPETTNTQSEQGLLSLLDLPVDTPIQRDGPPMPNVDVAPSVQTTAIQRETPASPMTSAAPSGGTENNEGEGEGADKAEVEKMANEVYRLLQRRLKVERERRSR